VNPVPKLEEEEEEISDSVFIALHYDLGFFPFNTIKPKWYCCEYGIWLGAYPMKVIPETCRTY
jgi:hypothetical protein